MGVVALTCECSYVGIYAYTYVFVYTCAILKDALSILCFVFYYIAPILDDFINL